jgi:hypothetical protein
VADQEVDAFVTAYEKEVAKLYPDIASNPDYTSIVNDRHYAPGGYGPSSPFYNLNEGSGLLGAAPSMKVEGLAAPVAPGTESPQLLRQ